MCIFSKIYISSRVALLSILNILSELNCTIWKDHMIRVLQAGFAGLDLETIIDLKFFKSQWSHKLKNLSEDWCVLLVNLHLSISQQLLYVFCLSSRQTLSSCSCGSYIAVMCVNNSAVNPWHRFLRTTWYVRLCGPFCIKKSVVGFSPMI